VWWSQLEIFVKKVTDAAAVVVDVGFKTFTLCVLFYYKTKDIEAASIEI
jgi:hypothetical protein